MLKAVNLSAYRKDLTDKPPVNADINNNIDTFHTTGGEGTHSEPIPIVNIAEWNNTVCSENLFDKTTVTSGKYIDLNGSLITSENYYVSDWFPLKRGTTYTISNRQTIRAKFFDINKIAIDTTNWAFATADQITFTPPANAYYLRFSIYYTRLDDLQINLGSSLLPYSSYTGKTYLYRLEDTDDNLHYGGDLPDGTADTYNRETREFTEIKGVKVLDGVTETWTLGDVETGLHNFYNTV